MGGKVTKKVKEQRSTKIMKKTTKIAKQRNKEIERTKKRKREMSIKMNTKEHSYLRDKETEKIDPS